MLTKGKTEADMMIEMLDENTECSVLIALVGEGQEINNGENDGIKHWSKAIVNSKNNWKVVCSNKLEENFKEERMSYLGMQLYLRLWCMNHEVITSSFFIQSVWKQCG